MHGANDANPACAICGAPPGRNCGCEATALEVAMTQAEERFFRPAYNDVRSWVRRKACDYILAYFHMLVEPCKDAHALRLDQLAAQSLYHHGPGARPARAAIDRAHGEYRHNVNRAWRCAVQRYPEVLDYFFSVVHLSVPADNDPAVRNPPYTKLGTLRTASRRRPVTTSEPRPPQFPIPGSTRAAPPLAVPLSQQQPPPWHQTPPPTPSRPRQHSWVRSGLFGSRGC